MTTSILSLFIQSGLLFTAVTGALHVVHVCEGEKMTISCVGGINVTSAIYGRTDNVTCSDPRIKTLDCRLDVYGEVSSCNGETTCLLSASNGNRDPCPGTYKYLEVSYTCPSEESTTPDLTTSTTTMTTRTTTTPPTSTELLTSSETRMVTTNVVTSQTNASCSCRCRYSNNTTCAKEDLLCRITMLKQQLLINKFALSSHKRTKISVYDGRTSSTVIGVTGVAVIVTVLSLIVIPDFLTLLKFMKRRACTFKKKRKRCPV
ncbi:rhamnose-binding lectin-like [Pecten maximus]|uniref:rhamnose-binding lectin-like n=1 Tax=Pecten maximus TaxID=6579 RepID=UPI0014586FE9|nr:rhamnose-binding lectin-like [Pecten maximus]